MKSCMKTFLVGQCVLLCVFILGEMVLAQNTMLSQSQDTRKQMFLSLEEAINLVLQNNLEISIEQYNPEIKKEDIKNAEAAFDSTFNTGGTQVLNETDSDQTPTGTTAISTGIQKRFTTGGSYELNLSTSRSTFDTMTMTVDDPETGLPVSTKVDVDDRYATGIELTFSHALLKNRGTDVNTTQIRIAQKNREVSISELRSTVIDVISEVKNTYWSLVYALGDLEVNRLALQLAYDLVKINEAQVNVGTLAPIEVLQAKATAASREVEIISAEQTVRDVEDSLKRLLNIPENDPIWTAAIIPTDAPVSARQSISLQESIQRALENREELYQLQKALEIQEISLNAADNQLKPELNAFSTLDLSGQDTDFGGSISDFTEFNEASVTLGLQFEYPLGNHAAKSSYNKARLGIDQTRLSIQNLEQAIAVQVRQAVRSVETSYKLVEASRVAQQLAEEQLDAEQKKFNEGLSTNFQVLNYQEQLASAQSRYTQAITGYNQALVALDQLIGRTLERHNIVIKE